jgi:hypothetical protein
MALNHTVVPERRRGEPWLYAGGLMLEAATQQGPMKIITARLTLALKAEGLI